MGNLDKADVDKAVAAERAAAIEEMVIDLMTWAMRTDRAFADRIAAEHNDWLQQSEREHDKHPTPETEAGARTARHFMGLLGIPVRPGKD